MFRRDGRLTKIILVVFFLIVIVYAYFEARGMLYGPKIEITSSVAYVQEPFIVIRGRADRISSLSMNGRNISVTEEGLFEEPYVLAPGINRIIFDAEDKYKRVTQKVLEIVYAESSTTQGTQSRGATSTPAASSTLEQLN